MRSILILLLSMITAAAPICLQAREDPMARSVKEGYFKKEKKLLIRMKTDIKKGTSGTSVTFTSDTLKNHHLYAKHGKDEYLHIRSDGVIESIPKGTGNLKQTGEILITPSGITLFADGKVLRSGLKGWTFYWVASEKKAPAITITALQEIDYEDSFMRTVLTNDYCSPGEHVTLKKHGGGLAVTEEEIRDPKFQRAVNPFTVVMKNSSGLEYSIPGIKKCGDIQTGASFYFGVPVLDRYVDRNSLPQGDLLVRVGAEPDGIAEFGWIADKNMFQLRYTDSAGTQHVLGTFPDKRPPVTNWVRIALEIKNGYELTGLLDGKKVISGTVPFRLNVPVTLVGSVGAAECDDFYISSIPVGESFGEPLKARNDHFAGKDNKGRSDPAEFRQWVESSAVFKSERWYGTGGVRAAAIISDQPLMGDFTYEAVPYSDTSGKLPVGEYEFRLIKADIESPVSARSGKPLFSLKAEWDKDGWQLTDPDSGEPLSLALLRFGRRSSRIVLYDGRTWLTLPEPVQGPVHFAVIRIGKAKGLLFSPSPNHHNVYCRNLMNEFFIKAPIAWNWVDGAFRMSSRWACQNDWNFMSCASYALPFMTSKKYFNGDQTHEYYMSLRSILPWDIGDREFTFDREADRKNKWAIYHAHDRWYNLRSLSFSFCTDGKNPLSGYSVVLGGAGNTQTQLLKRGNVVKSVSEYRYLIPSQKDFKNLHWHWFRFAIRKEGARIQVRYKGELIFDYTDPDPIPGGHAGFWTLRNGFIVTRLSSMAEEVGETPLEYYVTQDQESMWKPFFTDTVILSKTERKDVTRVTNHMGGGFFAVRHTFPKEVNLAESPVLNLPVTLSDEAHVDIHLYTNKGSFVITTDGKNPKKMRSLLTPEFEKGETFQVTYLDLFDRSAKAVPEKGVVRVNLRKEFHSLFETEGIPRLLMITVGNTSEHKDMVTGYRNNRAGSWYEVGVPGFSNE